MNKPKIFNDHKVWRIKGDRRRAEGPAIVWYDGTNLWFKKDLFHRTSAPALISSSGLKFWSDRGLQTKQQVPL